MNRQTLALACGTSVVGAVLLAGAARIDPGIGYDRVGPRAFPVAVGAGLVVIAAVLASGAGARRAGPFGPAGASERTRPTSGQVNAGVQPDTATDENGRSIDHRALAYVAAGMLLFVALVNRAGFVVAASVQFWLVARAFSPLRPLRDALIAVTLAVVVYVVFSRGLGLTLPGF